jgi:hypothetical protein
VGFVATNLWRQKGDSRRDLTAACSGFMFGYLMNEDSYSIQLFARMIRILIETGKISIEVKGLIKAMRKLD